MINSQRTREYIQNNPVIFIDPYGLERIIISGGVTQEDYSLEGPYEIFKYQFIETALKDIKDQNIMQTEITANTWGFIKPEKITWMVVNYGYSEDDITKFEEAAKLWSVELIIINKKDDFVNYINMKSVAGDDNGRIDDQITYLGNYSHGWAGEILWGYNSQTAKLYTEGLALNFHIRDIEKLNTNAFKNPYSAFFSSNAGTKNREGKSFAQEWVNKTMGTARAVVDGQTDYTDINMKEYRLDIPGLIDKWQAKKTEKILWI